MKYRFALLAAALIWPAHVAAQNEAFCALRDPVTQIYGLFPDATGYRSNVRTVGLPARDHVVQRVPAAIHFDELGRHTLYVVLAGERPSGLVHVRSEPSQWGLMELVWALDLDLRIRDFTFQRYRGRDPRDRLEAQIRELVVGRSFDEIADRLAVLTAQPRDATRLQVPALESALKTIAITEFVWPEEVDRSSDGLAAVFPGTIREREGKLGPNDVAPLLKEHELLDSQLRGNVRVTLALDEAERVLGCRVRALWAQQPALGGIDWFVSGSGMIAAVSAQSAGAEIRQALEATVGLDLGDRQSCARTTQLMALEAVAWCTVALRRSQ